MGGAASKGHKSKTIVAVKSAQLAEYPFARALAELWRTKASGVLELTNQNVNKSVFVREGIPVRVSSNIASELIGRYLVSRGEIDEATSLAALTKSVETDRYLGEVLVEMGALTPHALFTALRRCFGTRILDAFRWDRGSMEYKPGAPSGDGMDLEIPAVPLVLKGVASFLPFGLMQRDIPIDDGREFQLIAAQAEELKRPSPTQLRMLRCMGEATTLAGLVEASNVTEEEAFRFVYGLTVLGIAGSPEEAEASRAAVEAAKAEARPTPAPVAPIPEPKEPAARSLTDAERQLIDSMYMAAKSRSFFQVLGVGDKPLFAEVRRAFMEKCSKVSPMTFKGVDLGERAEQVEEIFLILVRAFSTLSEPDRRETYLKQLRARSSRREKRKAAPKTVENPFEIKTDLLDVEVHLQNGVNTLRERNSGRALQHFEFALNLQPDNPQALAYYGYCLFVVDSLNAEKAVGHIEKSIQLAPNQSLGHFMMGRVLEACDNYPEAQRSYSRCLRIEPGHQQAQAGQARLRNKLAGRQ